MSNPILTITNSNLDTRVKEPSGVVPPPWGVGLRSTPDRFTIFKLKKSFYSIFLLIAVKSSLSLLLRKFDNSE